MCKKERETFNLNWKAARKRCLGWFAWNVDKHHQPPWIQMRHLSCWVAVQGLQRKGSKICPESGVQWSHLLLFHFSGCARLCWPIKKPQDCPWLVISSQFKRVMITTSVFSLQTGPNAHGGNGRQKWAAVENLTQRWEERVDEAEPGLTAPPLPATAFAAASPEEQAGSVIDQWL